MRRLPNSQRALLDHDSKDFIKHISGSPVEKSVFVISSTTQSNLHCRQLRIGIISRRNLNDIRTNEVQAVKTTDDRPQLARGPTASLWCAGSGCDWIVLLATDNPQ